MLYVSQPPINERMYRFFRKRFRLPYESFLSLSEDVIDDPYFSRWTRCDTAEDRLMNVKLLLLGCLRYIGQAWTLDDISEANGISISTNRLFLLRFIEYGSSVLYKKWVIGSTINRYVNDQ